MIVNESERKSWDLTVCICDQAVILPKWLTHGGNSQRTAWSPMCFCTCNGSFWILILKNVWFGLLHPVFKSGLWWRAYGNQIVYCSTGDASLRDFYIMTLAASVNFHLFPSRSEKIDSLHVSLILHGSFMAMICKYLLKRNQQKKSEWQSANKFALNFFRF